MNIFKRAGEYFKKKRAEKAIAAAITAAIPALVAEQQERYDFYNSLAAKLGPKKPIRYNAAVGHRKKKSQKQNWKHWR